MTHTPINLQHSSQLANPITIETLHAALAASDAAISRVPIDARDLQFQAEGVISSGRLIRTDQIIRNRLFDKVGAPAGYLQNHSLSFQADALSAHASRGDFGQEPTLVLRDSELVTIVKGELFALANGDVIRSVEEELGDEGKSLIATRVERREERLDVDLLSPSKEISVRPGDIVRSGLHITHERFGKQGTQIEAFVYRLVCSNGMTRRECVHDGEQKARTRKLPADFPNNHELQMNQVRRLVRRNWSLLDSQLRAFKATSERFADVEEVLTRWLQRARISSDNMLPRLLAAWEVEGAERTHYGAINALTRVATHDRTLSGRQRRTLATLAGLLAFSEVHICQTCFSVLTKGASHGSHSAH